MKRQLIACGLLIVTFCVGCGQRLPPNKPTVAVGGKVVFGNGDPVRLAFIVFEPKDPSVGVEASALIDKDGRFNLRTYSPNDADGAVKGEYLVKVEPYDTGVNKVPKGVTPAKIPERFHKTATSGLTADVEDETDDLEVKLK
jgi:hypothetical protein